MSFNYRLIKNEIDNSIGIYEVYYDDNGAVKAHIANPIIIGNNFEDLMREMINIKDAFNKPILSMNILREIREDTTSD